MIFLPLQNSIEILQALYWLIIGDGGGLVETNMGGRETVITWAAEFLEEIEAAGQLHWLRMDHFGPFTPWSQR